jgi:toxin ParE1/3/4
MRYQSLVSAALDDLAQDPYRVGSIDRPEIAAGCRTYHLSNSRKRAKREGGNVKAPRHFVVYRIREETKLDIARILHDSMDMERQLARQPLE